MKCELRYNKIGKVEHIESNPSEYIYIPKKIDRPMCVKLSSEVSLREEMEQKRIPRYEQITFKLDEIIDGVAIYEEMV